jgi:hypothetical protein
MTPADVRQTVALAQKGLALARAAMQRAAQEVEPELADGLRTRVELLEDMEMSLALTEFELAGVRGLA